MLWLVSREGLQKAGLDDYHTQRAALSRFTVGALVQADVVLDVLRREPRRISPEARIENEERATVLFSEVLKRELLEGDKAQAAKRLVARAANRSLRKSSAESDEPKTEAPAPVVATRSSQRPPS
jgi:hypothetical protein